MSIKLFTTHCPKCRVLKSKLDRKKVDYEEVEDVNLMLSLGLKSAPNLQLEDGTILEFSQAVDYVNSLEDRES